MNVDIIDLSHLFCRFILSDVDAAFANGMRRSMMCEVPTMAIDEIDIYENSSVLYDEQLALRLGLVPLKTDLDSYILREDCNCEEGCNLCQVGLTLSAESPEIENQAKIVYSRDLISSDPNITPVYDNIPIVKLITKGGIRQKIMLGAIGRLGKGKEHSKWQAAVACAYKNIPKVTIQERCNSCGRCVEVCPRGILRLNDEIEIVDEIECSLCRLCEDICSDKAIKVEVDRNAFLFEFETDGSLSARELVLRATEVMKRKAEEFIDVCGGCQVRSKAQG